MREHHLSYSETARKYLCEKGQESIFKNTLKLWERIFLEEGEAGFYIERRGRTTKMDNEYLKKLDALVRKRLQNQKKK